MSAAKKLSYAAAAAAISVLSLVINRYFPLLSLTPLMLCAVCYFISFECGLPHGFLTIAASLSLGFLLTGLGSTFLLCALIFAPYSILAHFLKRFKYDAPLPSLIRIISVSIMLNVLLAILVFALGGFIDQLIFSYSLGTFLNNKAGYLILAILSTIIMLGFDFILSGLTEKILKALKISGEKRN